MRKIRLGRLSGTHVRWERSWGVLPGRNEAAEAGNAGSGLSAGIWQPVKAHEIAGFYEVWIDRVCARRGCRRTHRLA